MHEGALLVGDQLVWIPTRRDPNQSLVILQLQLINEASKAALGNVQESCLLPQYPLHVAMGVTDTTRAEILCNKESALSQHIRGVAIALNLDHVQDLAPPPLELKSLDQVLLIEALKHALKRRDTMMHHPQQQQELLPQNAESITKLLDVFERAQTIQWQEDIEGTAMPHPFGPAPQLQSPPTHLQWFQWETPKSSGSTADEWEQPIRHEQEEEEEEQEPVAALPQVLLPAPYLQSPPTPHSRLTQWTSPNIGGLGFTTETSPQEEQQQQPEEVVVTAPPRVLLPAPYLQPSPSKHII